MVTPAPEAVEHSEVAGLFTALVRSTAPAAWDAPSPVQSWRARDVVGHLTTWLPGFLASSSGLELPPGPDVEADPVGAWTTQTQAVQALLEDPDVAGLLLDHPHLGQVALAPTISQIYTADVFMHTWDLARATGQDVVLDEQRCAEMLAGMEPIEEMLRSSGHYGPRFEVAPDASASDRLMAFIGRDPTFTPDPS